MVTGCEYHPYSRVPDPRQEREHLFPFFDATSIDNVPGNKEELGCSDAMVGPAIGEITQLRVAPSSPLNKFSS